ncbi:MAG: hypothetical protein ACE5D6_06205 [Candidatus Zixiibacteriota bacterium]
MKRQIPFVLVFIFGMFMIFQYFVPHESSEWVYEFLLDWIYIIGILALALGIWSLFRVSVEKIKSRKQNWVYSYVTLGGLFIMMLFGFTAKNGETWGWYPIFVLSFLGIIYMIIQIMISKSKGLYLGLAGALMLTAILIAIFDNSWGFYIYTQEGLENSMFRIFFDHILIPILATMFSLLAFFIASAAYRAFRARNLLATLLLLAALIVMLRFNPYMPFPEYFSKTSNWLMNVPNLAAQRAIVIGIGLGIVATALKVILGIERGYMGKG